MWSIKIHVDIILPFFPRSSTDGRLYALITYVNFIFCEALSCLGCSSHRFSNIYRLLDYSLENPEIIIVTKSDVPKQKSF